MYKVVFAAFALLLTAYVSPSFAEKKKVTSPPDHVSEGCTDKIMCCIPGKGCFDPNTPTGYSCNNGHAQVVQTCKKSGKAN
jgi:hypothetical protein